MTSNHSSGTIVKNIYEVISLGEISSDDIEATLKVLQKILSYFDKKSTKMIWILNASFFVKTVILMLHN